MLEQLGKTVQIESRLETMDRYEAATALAAQFRLDVWVVLDELSRLYVDQDIPASHLLPLAEQIGEQTRAYEMREETVEWALALVRPEGFTRTIEAGGVEAYTAEIHYPKDKEHLLLGAQKMARENPAGFGFHYDPYNFDSVPEREFFVDLLKRINVQPAEVEDIYFTGGLTDPAKTDFYVEYRGEDNRWHRYTPDFVIRKQARAGGKAGTGRVLIVEIKSAQFEAATREDIRRSEREEAPITGEGRKAVALRNLAGLNPDKLRYELVFAGTGVTYEKLAEARRFVQEPERAYEADLTTAHRLKDLILKADGRPVRKIILFGSRARGDARVDSDFDLLVVVPGITPSEKRTYLVDLYAALRGVGVTAEPWVMDEREFEETKPVIGGLAYPAWKEGVVLYDNP